MSLPAAGWYPDPQDGSLERWWDGQGWTTEVRSPSTRLSSAGPGGLRWWLAGVATLVVVAAGVGWGPAP